ALPNRYPGAKLGEQTGRYFDGNTMDCWTASVGYFAHNHRFASTSRRARWREDVGDQDRGAHLPRWRAREEPHVLPRTPIPGSARASLPLPDVRHAYREEGG